ncbi:MAG TPA: metallophosphoesterase [bacterium]|nr:metallophosphoesterase [bacterium]
MNIQFDEFETFYLIADTHLNKKNHEVNSHFLSFLSKIVLTPKSCLIILGDFVDFWFENPLYDLADDYPVLKKIKEIIIQNNYRVYLIKGNRDFIAGKRFEKAAGIKVLGDDILIKAGNHSYYLVHGDIYCSKDISYLLWRKFSRSIAVKILTMIIPKFAAVRIIRQFRILSILKNAAQKPINLSISLKKICKRINDIKADRVICGHNHILRIKRLSKKEYPELNSDIPVKFMVLNKLQKWGGYYLKINIEEGETIETINATA